MLIRKEVPEDIRAIRELTYAAFKDHPCHPPPGSEPTEHEIVDKLRAAGALTLSLVAEREGRVLGHVAFSPVVINGQNCKWYGLGPVSVLPSQQRQGIGSDLIRNSIEILRDGGALGLVLMGVPDYYGRFGFRREAGLVYPDAPAEYFLVLPLRSDIPEGVVAYHSAFS